MGGWFGIVGRVTNPTRTETTPMRTIPVQTWIANAAARLQGTHGAVTHQARQTGCSRQAVYEQAQKVQAAVAAEYSGGPIRAELLREIQTLRAENQQLRRRLDAALELTVETLQHFTAKAWGMGLSILQIHLLLKVLMETRAPARATIHRWAQAAGVAAGRVLKQLDDACRALIRIGCLDEIFFHRRPVLVGVEPASLVWFVGQRVGRLSGSAWADVVAAWDALELAVADAGVPLQAGIARAQKRRQDQGAVPLDCSLDVFHTLREGQTALAGAWKRLEQDWEAYERAEAQKRHVQQQGIDARAAAGNVRRVWKKVVESFTKYEALESAWKQAKAALGVVRPDGQLNDRAWAESQIAAALPALAGPAWERARNHLRRAESLTFLDRLHAELAALGIAPELLAALVPLWWQRRPRPGTSRTESVAGAQPQAHRLQVQRCRALDRDWRQGYRRVAAVLRGVVRASSAVECLNSVLRMHQSRHRTVTQPMLDLKRLYWNTRAFVQGQRAGKCPYELLGLVVPSNEFWELLKDEFGTALEEAKARAKTQRQSRAA
jgi:hypothetical protein